jgi:leader peptidase (prepilin peptidase)/N-methyltransferase
MSGSLVCATVVVALSGLITPVLARLGLSQLSRPDAASARFRTASAIAGATAGSAAVVAWHRADTWWSLAGLLCWGCALAAAACCDAVTQRVPTPLVRQAGVVVGLLLTIAFAVRGDWDALVLSGVAAVASALILLICWRFAGAGFGDVRLATLGGLALGHASHRGLLGGFIAFAVITVIQAWVTFRLDGDRGARIPYGPALAAGYLLAASL